MAVAFQKGLEAKKIKMDDLKLDRNKLDELGVAALPNNSNSV